MCVCVCVYKLSVCEKGEGAEGMSIEALKRTMLCVYDNLVNSQFLVLWLLQKLMKLLQEAVKQYKDLNKRILCSMVILTHKLIFMHANTFMNEPVLGEIILQLCYTLDLKRFMI